MKVLLTGHRGYCGFGIAKVLLDYGYQVVGYDRDLSAGSFQHENLFEVEGDITDQSDLYAAMEGCQAVVHTAVGTRVRQEDSRIYGFLNGDNASIDAKYFLPFHINVSGTFNVFEVARQLCIRQVINLSSAAVVSQYIYDWGTNTPRDYQLRADTPPRFQDYYGFNKHLQEQIGEFYSRDYEMSVVTLRPWWVVDGRTFTNRYGKPLTEDVHPLTPAGLVCRYDLGELVHMILNRPDLRYEIYYPVAGPGSHRYFDVEPLTREINWQPQKMFKNLSKRKSPKA